MMTMKKDMIEIDGSYGSGGGQILRTALGLSAVTEKPFEMVKIRAGRCNPGIRPQHLEAIKSMANMCNAKVSGANINSMELKFYPGKIKSGNILIKIPTAGSVGLVLQSIMIATTKIDKQIKIIIDGGATNGKWAAPVNYIKHVLLPLLGKMGYDADINIERYGYYPKGGAKVNVEIKQCELRPINLLEHGKVISINGISHASKYLEKSRVAERQKESAEKILFKEFEINPKIEVKYVDSFCPGSAIDLWIITENSFIGSDGLGERGKKAEDVGKEAAEKLLEQIKSDAAVDEHAEDQLLPYMALACNKTKDKSKIKVPRFTGHTKTNIWVIEKFLPVKFDVDEEKKIIECRSE